MRLVRRIMIALVACAVAAVLGYDLWIGYEALEAKSLAQRRGFTCRWFTDSTGHHSRYIVFLPHVQPPETGYPVLMFLNGAGENGDDGVNQLSRNLGQAIWELKGRFPFVVVAPQCHKGGEWTEDGPDRKRALETLEEVIQEHQCDRDRVYLTGTSSGGRGVFAVAAANPELFAAIAPLCGSHAGENTPEEVAAIFAEHGLPVWNNYNERDAEDLVEFNREMQLALLRVGTSPHSSEFDREGHNCWVAAYRNPALYDWLLRQNRKFRPYTPEFQLLADQGVLAKQVLVSSGSAKVSPTGVIEMDRDIEEEFACLTIDRPVTDFELHLDCALNGVDPAIIELISDGDDVNVVARLVIELPSQGGGGVYRGTDAQCLASSDPVAQHSLQQLRWNEIRIRVADERLDVEANGWSLLSCSDLPFGTRPRRIQLKSATLGEAFRFPRLAVLSTGHSP